MRKVVSLKLRDPIKLPGVSVDSVNETTSSSASILDVTVTDAEPVPARSGSCTIK